MEGKAGTLLKRGINYALADYEAIGVNRLGWCVKPKEDQLKASIYRAYAEAGFTVHVEPAYARNKGRCDLMVASTRPIAIEIKTAWAGSGRWVNKPVEQHGNWLKDIKRLDGLSRDAYKAGLFVLLFAYEEGSDGEVLVREKIGELQPAFFRSRVIDLGDWNGLNKAECLAIQVF